MDDILYTISPKANIYPEDNELENLCDIIYQGTEMQVQHISFNKFKIIRLYSTDPKDYLQANLQPGQIISI